jgi:ABC-type Mn2+/Zn2+ transport system permease subunit
MTPIVYPPRFRYLFLVVALTHVALLGVAARHLFNGEERPWVYIVSVVFNLIFSVMNGRRFLRC